MHSSPQIQGTTCSVKHCQHFHSHTHSTSPRLARPPGSPRRDYQALGTLHPGRSGHRTSSRQGQQRALPHTPVASQVDADCSAAEPGNASALGASPDSAGARAPSGPIAGARAPSHLAGPASALGASFGSVGLRRSPRRFGGARGASNRRFPTLFPQSGSVELRERASQLCPCHCLILG